MRIATCTSLAAMMTAGILAIGCSSSTTMAPSAAPSGTNTTPPPATEPMTMPATMPAMAPMPSATHVLTADEPYFSTDPGSAGQGMAPAGMLKAGTPVLVMVPGAHFCKIVSNQGVTCYTLTSGLKPISDK